MSDTKSSRRIRVRNTDDDSFWVGDDARSYRFWGSCYGRKFRVNAGCHSFTMLQARKHWSEPRYSKEAGNFAFTWHGQTKAMEAHRARQRLPHIIRMLDAIEAEAVKRGWLREQKKAA